MSRSADTSASSLRIFAAVPLPESLKQTLGEYMSAMRRELPFRKWTHPEDLHITLQFLGDTSPERIPAISAALREAAGCLPPFRLSVAGPECFGRPEAPSVLWADIAGDTEPLHRLQRHVVSVLSPLGWQPEARPYRPHLTMARKYAGTAPFDAGLLRADMPPRRQSKAAVSTGRSKKSSSIPAIRGRTVRCTARRAATRCCANRRPTEIMEAAELAV